MGSIIVGKIRPETRLPQTEARELSSSTTVVGSLERAVECLLGAQARCVEVAAESENRSAAYAQAVADRYEAIRLLRDTPASSRVELETKRDILCELDRWIGRDDHACCDFAFHLVQEAIQLMNAGQADDEVEDSRVGYGHWVSPGRWLMGAAANVPAFIVDRFGLG